MGPLASQIANLMFNINRKFPQTLNWYLLFWNLLHTYLRVSQNYEYWRIPTLCQQGFNLMKVCTWDWFHCNLPYIIMIRCMHLMVTQEIWDRCHLTINFFGVHNVVATSSMKVWFMSAQEPNFSRYTLVLSFSTGIKGSYKTKYPPKHWFPPYKKSKWGHCGH